MSFVDCEGFFKRVLLRRCLGPVANILEQLFVFYVAQISHADPFKSSMSHPITIPVFGSTSHRGSITQQPTPEDKIADDVDWSQDMNRGGGGGGGGVGDTDMDFDLLAEYLLEENPVQGGSGMNFDFK
jgi:hypothetical protein